MEYELPVAMGSGDLSHILSWVSKGQENLLVILGYSVFQGAYNTVLCNKGYENEC